MTIKKQPDGKYKVEMYPNGRSGKRIRKTFKTLAEAKRFELHTLTQADADPWNPKEVKDHRVLSELIPRYMELHGNTLKDASNVLWRLNSICNELADPIAKEINKATVSECRARMTKKGKKANTINDQHKALSAMFNKLLSLGEIGYKTELKGLPLLKVPRSKLTFLELDELDYLLSYLKERDFDCYCIAKICASTGARWSEAQNIDRARVRKYSVTYVDTKTGGTRTVGISPELYNEIPSSTGQVFRTCYTDFRNLVVQSELELPKGQCSHVLRHTFATHFMRNGGNILDLKELLGHSRIEQTMVYAHFSPQYFEKAVTLNPVNHLKNSGDKVATVA